MKVITVGRSSENDVQINDSTVSRHHIQIIRKNNGEYWLADFGSKNGTYVNGKPVTGEVHLSPDDFVRIGNTNLPWQNYFVGVGVDHHQGGRGLSEHRPVGGGGVNHHRDPIVTPTPKSDDAWDTGAVISLVCAILGIIGFLGSLIYYFSEPMAGVLPFFTVFPIYLRHVVLWLVIVILVLGLIGEGAGVLSDSEKSSAGEWLSGIVLVIGVVYLIFVFIAKNQIMDYLGSTF